MTPTDSVASDAPLPLTALRGAIGGTLMGLANLVPGISGGTMLLAAGVYPGFIAAIAELTTLRFRPRSLVLLGTIVGAAALGILLLAGAVRGLVIDHRWVMYSLFVGLTLGGIPLIWRMARPVTPPLWIACAAAFALMCVMAFGGAADNAADQGVAMMFFAGVAAASAMILPGVSCGYLLLLLGQYENILGSVDTLKRGLLGDAAAGTGFDPSLVMEALASVTPLGIGVVLGVVGVSNALKWLLARFEKATLGALLGLLLGAVVGLWPFQQPSEPEPGQHVNGRLVSLETRPRSAPTASPLPPAASGGDQSAGALALAGAGLAATLAIGRLSTVDAPAD